MAVYNWTQLSPVHSPGPRASMQMAYDAARDRTVLYGGEDNGGAELRETWLWDGTDWTHAAPAHSPTRGGAVALAYDATHQQVVAFGGGTIGVSDTNETWLWDGTDWTHAAPVHSPPARLLAAMVYDVFNGNVVLFGGHKNLPDHALADTWIWDGTDWTQQAPAHVPTKRWSHSLAWSALNNAPLLFGGNYNDGADHFMQDTWLWGSGDWVVQAPATKPSKREDQRQLSEWLQAPLLFGGLQGNAVPGARANDTWLWEAFDWQQQAPAASPPVRDSAALAYHVNQGYALLFGGSGGLPSLLSDTWVYSTGPNAFEVAWGYGGVAPQGGGDRVSPTYLQSALPDLTLTPGCTLAVRAEKADGTLRTGDVWGNVRLWVDDGS